MPINTDFYGSENDWKSPSSECPELKTSSISDTDPTLTDVDRTAAEGSVHAFSYNSETNPEELASVPLDPSICPWGIGSGSDIFSQKYVYPSIIGGSDVSDFQFKVRTSKYYSEHDNQSYRFFLSSCRTLQTITGNADGVWDTRYAELSLRTELDDRYIYQRPILEFDYSKAFIVAHVLYIPKRYIDDKESNHTSIPSPSWNLSKFLPNVASPADLDNNYVFGFQFEVKYEGLENTLSLGLFPFDDIEPTDMANGPYYPYGRKYTHYATPFTTTYDTGQATRCAIGGLLNPNLRDKNQFIYTEKAIYDKNYTETSNLRHYNFPTIEGDGESYVLCNYIRRNSSSVTLVPNTWNDLGRDGILDYVMEQMAYLGFRFKIDVNDSVTYLPEIDANGITTGRYFAPDDPEIENQQNNNWTTDVFEKTPYNPGSVDPNTYDDNKTVLNTLSTIYDRFTNEYILNGTQLLALKNELYTTISSDVDSSFWSSQKFLTNNPLDVVKGLTFYPFDVANKAPNTGTLDNDTIVLGTIDTGVSATALIDSFIVIDCGSCTYFPVYGVNDFRSYAPYSTAELHIPYCGSVEISPELYLNHVISVKMIVDLKTGAALALIYRDGMVVDSVGGTVGITIPISGIERETLAAAEHQALSQYKTARNTAIGNIAHTATSIGGTAFDVLGTIGGGKSSPTQMESRFTRTLSSSGQHASDIMNVKSAIQNVKDAQYDLQHISIPYKTIGTASSVTSYANEPYCRLIIKRPIMLDGYSQSDFGHCYGFATNKTGVVSDFSGYTQFASVDLSGVNCSESMKAQIKAIMLSGVRI